MAVSFQVVVDCADPERLVRFWAEALGYQPAPPPDGFETWRDWYLSVGVPESELDCGDCTDRIVDPAGAGPRIWFQVVPEAKSVKNRLHFDVTVSGGRSVPMETRRTLIDAEAERLVGLGATRLPTPDMGGVDHYFAAMLDPEGNEFDIN